MCGYSSVGLIRPKDSASIGSVLRAAFCYEAKLVVIQGDRSNVKSCTDTTKAWRHMPVLRNDDLFSVIPYGATPVAVDLVNDAEELQNFEHPERAFYIFGPEDGTLGKSVLDRCLRKVMVPTRVCMNLATTVNVILYDRMAKRLRASEQ